MPIRAPQPDETEKIHRFLCANGWAHRVGDLEHFSSLLAASQRVVVAMSDAGEMQGFARGITDGLSNGYLSMVVVAPSHRRQGIGRALVQHIMGADLGITWVLRAGREDAPAFFAALGFRPSPNAMERPRDPSGH
nr:GNAT family N-acetyltransferase [uncultured Albidiferax sp.]